MATEINPIIRPYDASSHHSARDLHAQYTAQSAQWKNGKGPQFHEVKAKNPEAPKSRAPWWKVL